MNNYEKMKETLLDMEKIAQALNIEPFTIYFLGGSACILGKYTDRATRDFDFIDLQYPAGLGRVLRHLSDFDMLEYENTTIAPSYKERAKKLQEFTYLNIYVLSMEDIIVSKIVRMEQKDLEDMDELIKKSDKNVIRQIIDEVLRREDLYESKKEAFLKNLSVFRERYNV